MFSFSINSCRVRSSLKILHNQKADSSSPAVWSLRNLELESGWWEVWTLVVSGPLLHNWMLAGWRQVHGLSDWASWPFIHPVILTLIIPNSELIRASHFPSYHFLHLHVFATIVCTSAPFVAEINCAQIILSVQFCWLDICDLDIVV